MIQDLAEVTKRAQELYPTIIESSNNEFDNLCYKEGNNYYISKSVVKSSLLFHFLYEKLSESFLLNESIFNKMFSDDPSTNKFNITPLIMCNKRKKRWIIIEGI